MSAYFKAAEWLDRAEDDSALIFASLSAVAGSRAVSEVLRFMYLYRGVMLFSNKQDCVLALLFAHEFFKDSE